MDRQLIDSIAASLKELAARGGEAALSDDRRVRGKLADSHPHEIAARNIVVEALKLGVPDRLKETNPELMTSAVRRESGKLRQQFGVDPAFAHGAVMAWALALGLSVNEAQDQGSGIKSKNRIARWSQSLVFSDGLDAKRRLSAPKTMAIVGVVALIVLGGAAYWLLPRTLTVAELEQRNADALTAVKDHQYAKALDLALPRAKDGDQVAQYIVATIYDRGGFGLTKNTATAIQWYEQSAKQNYAKAQYGLGSLLESRGTQPDFAPAYHWLDLAAKQGNRDAITLLGYMTEKGEGTAKDLKAAAELYLKAAKLGDPAAQFNIALCYQYGRGVKADEREAFRWSQQAAKNGHARALNQTGYFYERGIGVKSDTKAALQNYRQAADKGDAVGQYNLGRMLAHGVGIDRNPTEAVGWYRKAAAQGVVAAERELGIALINGLGTASNEQEGLTWLKRASARGDREAGRYLTEYEAKKRKPDPRTEPRSATELNPPTTDPNTWPIGSNTAIYQQTSGLFCRSGWASISGAPKKPGYDDCLRSTLPKYKFSALQGDKLGIPNFAANAPPVRTNPNILISSFTFSQCPTEAFVQATLPQNKDFFKLTYCFSLLRTAASAATAVTGAIVKEMFVAVRPAARCASPNEVSLPVAGVCLVDPPDKKMATGWSATAAGRKFTISRSKYLIVGTRTGFLNSRSKCPPPTVFENYYYCLVAP